MFAFGRVGRCCCCYDLVQVALAVCIVASSFCTPIQPRTKFQPRPLKSWIEGKLCMFKVQVVFVDQISLTSYVCVCVSSLFVRYATSQKGFC